MSYNQNNIIEPFISEKAKILIVDDSKVTLKIEEDLMKAYGMDVTTAKSGEECLDLLNTNKYDIIFMDHMMPNMDGLETTLKIRKRNNEYFKNVIIIALTANTSPNVCSMYIKNGFNDFLEKPIELTKLNKIIRAYLPRKYIIEPKIITSNIEEFSELKIKDIDTAKAIEACCGNLENYLSLLSVAYHDGKNKIKIIKEFANTNDIKNYTIEVHALKTVAALIGATSLSELSSRHEIAGTSNDFTFISKNIDSLLNNYDAILNNIKLVLPKDDIDIKPKIKDFTIQQISDLVIATADAIDNFDLDLISETLNHLLNYDLSDSQISTLNKVKSYINVLDYDNAFELITKFNSSLPKS